MYMTKYRQEKTCIQGNKKQTDNPI